MTLSKNAQKLLAWFGLYKTTAVAYSNQLALRAPKAQRRGAFADALAELYAGGY